MDEPEIKSGLVKRYVANQASPDELKVFFHLLREGKLDKELSNHLESEMIAELKESIQPDLARHEKAYRFDWRIAASIILVAAAGFLTYLKRADLGWGNAENRFSYIVTGRSEIKRIKLPDGSLIWLNESSKLKYPQKFEGGIRELFLEEGEAYFDIERDETKPFVVHAAGTETKVLGTEFNIRSYRHLPSVEVTVSEGKVAVAAEADGKSRTMLLLPNQRASFDKTKTLTFQDKVNSGNATGWKQGLMIFDNETLGNVVLELQRKYNIPIEISGDDLQNIRLTAEFESKDSLPAVLDALSLANKLTYELKDGKVLLKSVR